MLKTCKFLIQIENCKGATENYRFKTTKYKMPVKTNKIIVRKQKDGRPVHNRSNRFLVPL